MDRKQTDTLIIGASIAGLATAASLKKKGLDFILIEKNDQIAGPWRNHYERLHLHTSKRLSHLPYKRFAAQIPQYPSRQQVVDYLDEYRKEFGIEARLQTEAISVQRENGLWQTETSQGLFSSPYLVMATGAYGKPKPLQFAGMESFPGPIFHSAQYKTGREFTGRRVLVVGFGNSACEIAIDLYEQGALPAMSVRSPVNVIPRDLLGIPILELSLLMSRLPPKLADLLSAPLVRLQLGDISKLGLKKKSYGVLEEIHTRGKVPLLDIGTISHIRKGHIHVFGDIDHMDGHTVYFRDGKQEDFDAIVAAIGYYRDYADYLAVDKRRFDDLSQKADKQKYFGEDGLYFCGYWVSPTGQIREISRDAKKIARDIFSKCAGRLAAVAGRS